MQDELQVAQAKLNARRAEDSLAKARGIAPTTTPQFPQTMRSVLGSRPRLLQPGNSSGVEVDTRRDTPIAPLVCPRHGQQAARWQARPAFTHPERGVWVRDCWDCVDEGRVRAAEEERRGEAEQRRRSAERIGALERPGRGLADLEVDVGNRSAVVEASALLEAGAGGLYIHGGNGRGKTALAEAIATDFHARGCTVRYWRASELFTALLAGGVELTAWVREVPALVLDNLDGVSLDDWRRSVLTDLVLARYARRAQVATVMTATVSPAELATALAMPLVDSRWQDWGAVARLTGQDRRARRG